MAGSHDRAHTGSGSHAGHSDYLPGYQAPSDEIQCCIPVSCITNVLFDSVPVSRYQFSASLGSPGRG